MQRRQPNPPITVLTAASTPPTPPFPTLWAAPEPQRGRSAASAQADPTLPPSPSRAPRVPSEAPSEVPSEVPSEAPSLPSEEASEVAPKWHSHKLSKVKPLSHTFDDLRDFSVHLFGCLTIEQRNDAFKREDHPVWNTAHELACAKHEEHRSRAFEKSEEPTRHKVREHILQHLLDDELLRVKRIRSMLLHEDVKRHRLQTTRTDFKRYIPDPRLPAKEPTGRDEELGDSLMANVNKSLKRWRKSVERFADDCKRRGENFVPPRQPGDKDKFPEDLIKVALTGCEAPATLASGPPTSEEIKEFLYDDIHLPFVKLKRVVGKPGVVGKPDVAVKLDVVGEPDVVVEPDVAVDPKLSESPSPEHKKSLDESQAKSGPMQCALHELQEPYQRISLKDAILSHDDGFRPLPEEDGTESFQHLHVPFNNMTWVEKLIKAFCGNDESKRRRILQPNQWIDQRHDPAGNQHEGVVHSRHLRSLCRTFSTSNGGLMDEEDAFVVFMPYLHWETDRSRSKMQEVIERRVDVYINNKYDNSREVQEKRIKKRKEKLGTCLPTIHHKFLGPWFKPDLWSSVTPRVIQDVAWRVMKDHQHDNGKDSTSNVLRGVRVDKFGRLRPAHPLAQLLVDAARLFEAITAYQDRLVLEKYLFKYEGAIHPRRTLDQSYMWELHTTRRRDRDQVVYRYTCPDFRHELVQNRKKKEEPRPSHWRKKQGMSDWKEEPNSSDSRTEPSLSDSKKTSRHAHHGPKSGNCAICRENYDNMAAWQWSWRSRAESPDATGTGHSYYEDHRRCQHCIGESKKLARAIMVDQLWMWILDQNTILTCFPKRWGIGGRKDPSGVFQSISKRIQGPLDSSNQIYSVYDLGLIILEECFDTFFDKTNMPDRRPQIMDIFAASIGQVMNRQTIATRHVWDLSKELTSGYNAENSTRQEKILRALLDQTPESKLQTEIRDIIDEIDMMVDIVRQQKDVIDKYVASGLELLSSERRGLTPEGSLEYRNFEQRATTLKQEVNIQMRDLETLKGYASNANTNVNDLINLKQQQASVIQAHQAIMQGEVTVIQGKAIMVFTILTIVFLPMSFVSSIFGMNNVDFGSATFNTTDPNAPNPPWFTTTVNGQLRIVAASVGVVLIVLFVTFNSLSRTLIWAFGRCVARLCIRWLPFYRLWLKSILKNPKLFTWTEKISDRSNARTIRTKKKVNKSLIKAQLEKNVIAALDAYEKAVIANKARDQDFINLPKGQKIDAKAIERFRVNVLGQAPRSSGTSWSSRSKYLRTRLRRWKSGENPDYCGPRARGSLARAEEGNAPMANGDGGVQVVHHEKVK